MNLLAKNENFIIYGGNELIVIKDELFNQLLMKKEEFLKLFGIANFPQIIINLFEKREDYYNSFESANNLTINICYQGVLKSQLLNFFQKYILHDFIYMLFQSYPKEEIPLWLKEGMAVILNGEKLKLEQNEEAFKAFYLDRIVRRDKEIPDRSFFSKKSKGEFVNSNIKYSWEDISYLLFHYLIENYDTIYEVINNIDKIKLSETLIEECISYYNQKYPVNNNFYEIKTDSELMDYMNKNIIYGWLDQDKDEHIENLNNYREKYRSATIEEILKSKLGTCAEQAKLIKYWFDMQGIENKMFCYRNVLEDNVKDDAKMHCFVLFYYQNYWYHFEHATLRLRGIHRYATLDIALDAIKKFYTKLGLNELVEIPDIPENLTYRGLNEYVSNFSIYEEIRGR